MLGTTSTNRWNTSYRYYACFSKRRKKHNCNALAIHKKELEDIVFKKTWEMIYENNDIDEIVNKIYKYHKNSTQENTILKSLEKKRAEALKASANLISAIEQGIITEQTKTRLKELEAQISQYDFDIEQSKQRTYAFLTPEIIKEFFKKSVCGDIENIEIRKLIARFFIREIILYKDKIVITYNFTENNFSKKTIPDNIEDIEAEIKQSETTAYKKGECEYKSTSTLPIYTK